MILQQVIALVAAQFHLPEDAVSDETTFDELDADEMDMADILLAVESEFEIDLGEDPQTPETVSDLVDIIAQSLLVEELD